MAYTLNSRPGNEVAQELAAFLDKSLGTSTVASKVAQDFKSGKASAAVSSLISESAGLWKTDSASDKDVEGFYALLSHFLLAPEYKVGDDARDAVIAVLTNNTSRATTRLSVLNHLFNSGLQSTWKLAFFEAIVKLSIEAKQSNILDGAIQDIDRLVASWGASAEEKMKLHLLLSKLFAESEPWLSHVHQMKWIESFKTEAECEKQIAELTQAVEAALARPDVFQYQTLIICPAATAVSKKQPDLIKLATLFTKGNYQEFVTFSKSTKIFTAPSTLSLDAAATKARILTLVSMAQERSNIPYQDIATALEVPVEDVESWILDTIAEGLIDAKLDHLSSSIFITYAFRREFGSAQWTDLHDKLGKWMDNIKSMLNVIHEARSHPTKEAQHTALKHALVGPTH